MEQPTELTLRDYFAAAALQGLLANPDTQLSTWRICDKHVYIDLAYEYADRMLKKREQPPVQ